MDKLEIKYSVYQTTLPPQPIRITADSWAGIPMKMENGSEPQPWHCTPFVEGSTYGLELLYPYDNECHVVNDAGRVYFEWDYSKEPNGTVTGGEFQLSEPSSAAKFYIFNTRLDIQPPPGYVIRLEPHPRFFTDDTDTVPLTLVGHLQNEWWPRLIFVVLRAPRPGQRHIFRKREPYAQIVFVPGRAEYDIKPMTKEEEKQRRDRENAITQARFEIATHSWHNATGIMFSNHYKVLARAFARNGLAGVDEVLEQAMNKQRALTSPDKSIEDCLAVGLQMLRELKYNVADEIFTQVLNRDPYNAEAICHLGICAGHLGYPKRALDLMQKAVEIQPQVPHYLNNLGELLARMGRLQEAEAAFVRSLQLKPNDAITLSALGLAIAVQGRMPQGLAICRDAARLDGTKPEVHLRLGIILAQLQQTQEARSCFEAALRLDPEFLVAKKALQDLR